MTDSRLFKWSFIFFATLIFFIAVSILLSFTRRSSDERKTTSENQPKTNSPLNSAGLTVEEKLTSDPKPKEPDLPKDDKFLPVPDQYIQELGELKPLMNIWPRLPKPGPHDWLSIFPEKGQTVANLLSYASRRAKNRSYGIVILPISPLDEKTKGSLQRLGRFLEITYQCDVKMKPIIDAPKEVFFRGGKQINAPLLLDRLVASKPDDVWGMAGITSFDLGEEGMNFVFGMSSPTTGVSVTSNARKGSTDPSIALRRLMSTLAHELGHALGMSHCIAFSCMMNGSNHIAESDERPTMFCPHCQKKLSALRGTEPVKILQELMRFYAESGLHQDRELATQAYSALTENVGNKGDGDFSK